MISKRAKEQGWILDRFGGRGGIDTFFSDLLPGFLEIGHKYMDLKRAAERSKTPSMLTKAFMEAGQRREQLGQKAEAEGHNLTARDEYHRAALCYARAQWAVFALNDRKRELHAKCVAAYDKVIKYNDYPLEKVKIPFGDGHLHGLLHLPPDSELEACVLFCPGLDRIKEEFPNVENNIFIKRGMAVLSLDGPGHGESRINGQKWRITGKHKDNYADAARVTIDYLAKRREVDVNNIGVFGISQGSYWGPVMAASDNRIKACACMMGSFYEQGFDLGQPSFKENLIYMTGAESEEEIDEIIPYITVDGLEKDLHCAVLVLSGEFDELCPEEDARRFVSRAINASSAEIIIYEDEFHGLGGVSPEAYAKVADWFSDQLIRPKRLKER